jgi:hypothetical protein
MKTNPTITQEMTSPVLNGCSLAAVGRAALDTPERRLSRKRYRLYFRPAL